jgi:hypothetical protein
MANYIFRDELSPDSFPGTPLQNTALPIADTDLFSPVTLVGATGKIGAFEVYFVPSVSGVLYVCRTTPNTTTTSEKLNGGNAIGAGVKYSDVIVGATGDIVSLRFSATTGTLYLTMSDVSGDMVKWVKA